MLIHAVYLFTSHLTYMYYVVQYSNFVPPRPWGEGRGASRFTVVSVTLMCVGVRRCLRPHLCLC